MDELLAELARNKAELEYLRGRERERDSCLALGSEECSSAGKIEELEVENRNIKQQVGILQERIRNLTYQLQLQENENTGLKQDHSDLRIQMDRRRLEELKALLSRERTEKEQEFKSFAILQNEHAELKKAFEELQCRYEVLKHDMEGYSRDGRRSRSDFQGAKLRVTQLEGQVSDMQDLLSRKDLETQKWTHKCEMMCQLNSTLEEESRTLLRQMDTLIIQNQDLLQQALMDKEHYHAEEKELQEKLNALKRHKEKLEEKIMDQYKTMDSPTKIRDTFMKRAARAFIPKGQSKKGSHQKGASSSGDDNSNLSADEGGFNNCSQYRSFTLPNGENSVYGSTKECTSSSVRYERARARASSSDELEKNSVASLTKAASSTENLASPTAFAVVSHKRTHSSSTQAESTLSSGTGSNQTSNSAAGSAEGRRSRNLSSPLDPNGRISWAGSERAVDVPGAPKPQQVPNPPKTKPPSRPPQHSQTNCSLPPRCPPNSTNQNNAKSSAPPPLPPPRNYVVTSRPPPPPYPAKNHLNGTETRGLPPPKPRRPPPPPYPGKRSATGPDLNRFRPDLAAETCSPPQTKKVTAVVHDERDACDVFTPQTTSTPKSEHCFSFVGQQQRPSSASNENSGPKIGSQSECAVPVPGGSSVHPGNNSFASNFGNQENTGTSTTHKFPLGTIHKLRDTW